MRRMRMRRMRMRRGRRRRGGGSGGERGHASRNEQRFVTSASRGRIMTRGGSVKQDQLRGVSSICPFHLHNVDVVLILKSLIRAQNFNDTTVTGEYTHNNHPFLDPTSIQLTSIYSIQ